MHRSLPAVLVAPLGYSLSRSLGCRALGIFGDGLRTRFRHPRHRPPGQALSGLRRARWRAVRARLGGVVLVLTAAETDRGQPLQQRFALSFRMLRLWQLAATGADLVLLRHR